MYRQIENTKRTADIATRGPNAGRLITVSYDDGWEVLLDTKVTVANVEAAQAWLQANGYEEFDPNASLKAKGMVWTGYVYA